MAELDKPRKKAELATTGNPLPGGAVDETIGAIYDQAPARQGTKLRTRVVVKKRKIALVLPEDFALDLDDAARFRGETRSAFVLRLLSRPVEEAIESRWKRFQARKAKASLEGPSPTEQVA